MNKFTVLLQNSTATRRNAFEANSLQRAKHKAGRILRDNINTYTRAIVYAPTGETLCVGNIAFGEHRVTWRKILTLDAAIESFRESPSNSHVKQLRITAETYMQDGMISEAEVQDILTEIRNRKRK